MTAAQQLGQEFEGRGMQQGIQREKLHIALLAGRRVNLMLLLRE
jgi:hypothetical protein